MSDIAIRVEHLGKQYRIGGPQARYRTLREGIVSAVTAPARWLSSPRVRAERETFWALKDVSFEVRRGGVVGIIGRNGAGKSTLLKILSSITKPTEGRVMLNGRVGSLLEVGTGFHAELTGRENIYLNGAILGMQRAEIERKFDEIVAFAEVEKFIDTPVKHYSSGMYVRLAFAVAAHLEPEVLVVDEVLAVGDHEFQRKCLGKMATIGEQGRTVLFVSHDLRAIKRLCHKAVWLENGQVRDYGTVGQVIDAYLSNTNKKIPASEISPEMHWQCPPDLEVYRVELLNSRRELTTVLKINERFSIRVSFRVRTPEKHYRIGILFYSSDGIRLATITTTDDGHAPLVGSRDATYSITAELQNIFMPGNYSLGMHIKASPNELVDKMEGILNFSVEMIQADAGEIRGAGIVSLHADWSPPSLCDNRKTSPR